MVLMMEMMRGQPLMKTMMLSWVHVPLPWFYMHWLIIQAVWLQKEWDVPVYVFFKALPTVQYIKNHKAHVFQCAASQCLAQKRFVCQFLDTSNSKSTSNLQHHVKICWGKEAVQVADGTRNIKAAHAALETMKTNNGSIMAAFQRVGSGTTVYSHHQHTKTEAWYVWLIFHQTHN